MKVLRLDMNNIEMYTRPGCGYCTHAKRLLASKGLAFTEYDVYQHPEKISEMCSRTKGRTYPQLFINNQAFGGFEALLQLEKHNRLSNGMSNQMTNEVK
jgi:glutaredoxin 3